VDFPVHTRIADKKASLLVFIKLLTLPQVGIDGFIQVISEGKTMARNAPQVSGKTIKV
jgi:hypothetical protein